MKFDNIDTTGMTGGNTMYLQGLPFTPEGGATTRSYIGAFLGHNITFVGSVVPRIRGSLTYMTFVQVKTAVADLALTVAGVDGATSDIEFSITYRTT